MILIYGVPPGSILGPLVSNIYLSDLFIFCKNSNIAYYADDNSPYSCSGDIELYHNLESDTEITFYIGCL